MATPPAVLLRAYAPSLAVQSRWLDSRPLASQLDAWPLERDSLHLQVLSKAPPGALGASPAVLLERIRQKRQSLADDPAGWNETTAALRRIRLSSSSFRLGFSLSEYAANRIVTESFAAHAPASLRTHARLWPFASQSFGVNLSVLTADHQVLLAVRGTKVDSHHGLFHCAMNEGMNIQDIDSSRQPDVFAAIVRGLQEELGIDHDCPSARIQSLFVTSSHQWAISGFIDLSLTSWTADRLRAAHNQAPDRHEANLWFVAHEQSALCSALREPSWIPHGALTVALAAIDSLGWQSAPALLDAIAPHVSLKNLATVGVPGVVLGRNPASRSKQS